MKLERVRVREFQSIRDSNEFSVSDITCLVGKNEAGKTAILKALYRLNPIIEAHGTFDVTDDYPRADVENYRRDIDSRVREPAVVITVEFTLGPDEVAEIGEAFGPGILSKQQIILAKGYDNRLRPTLFLNEAVAVARFIRDAQLPSEVETHLAQCDSLSGLHGAADGLQNDQI